MCYGHNLYFVINIAIYLDVEILIYIYFIEFGAIVTDETIKFIYVINYKFMVCCWVASI